MVRAPTRLEILDKIEKLVNEAVKSSDKDRCLMKIIEYVKNAKDLVLKELERRREVQSKKEKSHEKIVAEMRSAIEKICQRTCRENAMISDEDVETIIEVARELLK